MTDTETPSAAPAVTTVSSARTEVHSTFSARELIGYQVLNGRREAIGHIHDLLLDGERIAFAVLSVGGFLGLETHHVAVAFSALRIGDDIVLPGATKESLKEMAAYDKRHRPQPARKAVEGAGEAVISAGGEPVSSLIANVTDG